MKQIDPIDYEDKDGKPLGINPSILSIIAQKQHLFDYISFEVCEAFLLKMPPLCLLVP